VIYLLLSVVLFSLNNVLWKQNLKLIPVTLLISYRAVFTTSISLFVLFYIGIDRQYFIGIPLFRVTIGSLFGVTGLYCMLSVIKKASLYWLGIYNMIGIVFTALYLHLYENIYFTDSFVGLLLIGIGFWVYIIDNKRSNQRLDLKQHLLLLCMVLSFGISSVLHWKNLDSNIPAIYILFNQEMVVLIVSSTLLYLSSSSKTKTISKSKEFFFKILVMALVIFLALIFSFLGLEATNPLISSVLFLATPLLTILLGALIFKEDITLVSMLSIILIAIGAFWIHYNSNN